MTLGTFSTMALPILAVLVAFLYLAIRVVPEYERLVIFRLGRLIQVKGPGLVLLIPIVDRAVRMSLRIHTLDVARQEVITRDNVTAGVDAVVYYRVVDPAEAVVAVQNYSYATTQLAQTTLRSVVGQAELDEVLSERDKLNARVQEILDEGTNPWGIKVTQVEIRDVTIPTNLVQAIARQAEAERQRRALVIQSRGEEQAADALVQAARKLNSEPGGLTLRVLRTLPELTAGKGNTVVFPVPMELATLLGSVPPASALEAGRKPATPDPARQEEEEIDATDDQ